MALDYSKTIAHLAGMEVSEVETMLAMWDMGKLRAQYEYVEECYSKMEASLKRQVVQDVQAKIEQLEKEKCAMAVNIKEKLSVSIMLHRLKYP